MIFIFITALQIEPSGLGLPSKNYYYDSKYEKVLITEMYFQMQTNYLN